MGLQGLGASEGAYQKAVDYARERVQGGVPIIEHPDVKRMLMTMRALNEAMRALAYIESLTMDLSHGAAPDERGQWKARLDLMIPVIKGWMTEVGQEVCSLGVQVHGGMGYVEETGAAQYLRDVRITPIYEGTNGIQAADLVNRKLARDGGATMEVMHSEIRAVADALAGSSDDRLASMGAALGDALSAHVMTTQTLRRPLQDRSLDGARGIF